MTQTWRLHGKQAGNEQQQKIGYGAQGGTASDVAMYLKNGNGGVVNSSRKILLAHKAMEDSKHFAECSRKEAVVMRDAIKNAILELK